MELSKLIKLISDKSNAKFDILQLMYIVMFLFQGQSLKDLHNFAMNFQIENVSCNSEEDLHSFVQLDFITCRAHKANSLVPCIRKVAKSCQALLKLLKLTKAQFVKKKQNFQECRLL